MDVLSNKALAKTCIPVIAGDQTFYPSLAAVTSQYQFYRFKGLILDYTPVCGASTNGQVAFAPVASYRDYDGVTTWDEVVGLPNVTVTNVWHACRIPISSSSLNRQVVEGWRSITPASDVDYEDVTESQGFVVVAIQGCATTDLSLVLGRVAVTYDAELFKPRVNAVVSDVTGWSGDGTLTDDDSITGGSKHATISTTRVGIEYKVTLICTRPVLVFARCNGNQAGAKLAFAGSTADDLTACLELHETHTGTGAASLYRITPAKRGASFTVIADQAATAVQILVHDSVAGRVFSLPAL